MATLWKWAARVTASILALVFVFAGIGWAWENWAEAGDAQRFRPPGRMFDVGAGQRHIFCEGQGAPTVILESGGGDASLLLRPLQDRVAKFTRVCAHDRAGLGWSEPARQAMNVIDHAAELHALLTRAGESGPFVIVGHSFGGVIARQFTKDEPRDIVGLVLVDSVEEGFVFSPWAQQNLAAGVEDNRRYEMLARFGIIRAVFAIDPSQSHVPADLSNETRGAAISFTERPSYFRASADETANAYRGVPGEMRRAGGFGALDALPLVVIRHGRATSPDKSVEARWAEAQARLAALSSDSEEMVAIGNGHTISQENPDLVASKILDVIDAVRAKRPLVSRPTGKP